MRMRRVYDLRSICSTPFAELLTAQPARPEITTVMVIVAAAYAIIAQLVAITPYVTMRVYVHAIRHHTPPILRGNASGHLNLYHIFHRHPTKNTYSTR